jgi:hypothetical protein
MQRYEKKKQKESPAEPPAGLINQTYKTHYESPKIKIFLIYYLFLIYLFISLLNKQIKYGNNQKTEKRNKLKRTLHFA